LLLYLLASFQPKLSFMFWQCELPYQSSSIH
jgi:hypothetical protein